VHGTLHERWTSMQQALTSFNSGGVWYAFNIFVSTRHSVTTTCQVACQNTVGLLVGVSADYDHIFVSVMPLLIAVSTIWKVACYKIIYRTRSWGLSELATDCWLLRSLGQQCRATSACAVGGPAKAHGNLCQLAHGRCGTAGTGIHHLRCRTS
jgi:hypothetical protein